MQMEAETRDGEILLDVSFVPGSINGQMDKRLFHIVKHLTSQESPYSAQPPPQVLPPSSVRNERGWRVAGLEGFSGYLSCSFTLSIFIVTLLLLSSLWEKKTASY